MSDTSLYSIVKYVETLHKAYVESLVRRDHWLAQGDNNLVYQLYNCIRQIRINRSPGGAWIKANDRTVPSLSDIDSWLETANPNSRWNQTKSLVEWLDKTVEDSADALILGFTSNADTLMKVAPKELLRLLGAIAYRLEESARGKSYFNYIADPRNQQPDNAKIMNTMLIRPAVVASLIDTIIEKPEGATAFSFNMGHTREVVATASALITKFLPFWYKVSEEHGTILAMTLFCKLTRTEETKAILALLSKYERSTNAYYVHFKTISKKLRSGYVKVNITTDQMVIKELMFFIETVNLCVILYDYSESPSDSDLYNKVVSQANTLQGIARAIDAGNESMSFMSNQIGRRTVGFAANIGDIVSGVVGGYTALSAKDRNVMLGSICTEVSAIAGIALMLQSTATATAGAAVGATPAAATGVGSVFSVGLAIASAALSLTGAILASLPDGALTKWMRFNYFSTYGKDNYSPIGRMLRSSFVEEGPESTAYRWGIAEWSTRSVARQLSEYTSLLRPITLSASVENFSSNPDSPFVLKLTFDLYIERDATNSYRYQISGTPVKKEITDQAGNKTKIIDFTNTDKLPFYSIITVRLIDNGELSNLLFCGTLQEAFDKKSAAYYTITNLPQTPVPEHIAQFTLKDFTNFANATNWAGSNNWVEVLFLPTTSQLSAAQIKQDPTLLEQIPSCIRKRVRIDKT